MRVVSLNPPPPASPYSPHTDTAMEFLLDLTKDSLIIISGILGGVICALHFITTLAKGNIAKISQYVNIILHIILFGVLLISQIAIEVGVAVFMSSVFIYTLLSFIKQEWDKRRNTAQSGEEAQDDL